MHTQTSSIHFLSPYVFQGQESDDEIKGEGNSVNYKYRMHDPRLGRFFAIDPLASKYPHNSVYAFSENRVIDCRELEGLEAELAALGLASDVGTGYLVICTSRDAALKAKEGVEGTMFDYIIVSTLEDASKYANTYMKEHNLSALHTLVFFSHASDDGVPVNRQTQPKEAEETKYDPLADVTVPKYGPYIKDRISPEDLKTFNENIDDLSEGDKYSTGIFVGIVNLVEAKGTYVQLSCLVRGEDGTWGENLSKATDSRFDIFVNGDYSSVGNLFNSALTCDTRFSEGWFKYPNTTGTEQPLNNSIQISGETGGVISADPLDCE